MAINLSKKLDRDDTVLVFDVNSKSVTRFVEEALTSGSGSAVKAVSSAREAAERSVSPIVFHITSNMMNVFPINPMI